MSSTAQQISPAAAANERRFYSRFVPNAPICIAIDGKTEGLVLNVSENGLLVSTLTELPCNFVTQVSIPLNGLPKPVQVNVRVVWSSEARMLAGIQLINLSEYDREQIRMWGAQTTNFLLPREGNGQSARVYPAASESGDSARVYPTATTASAKVVTPSGMPGAIGSGAALAPHNSATVPPQRPAALAEQLIELPPVGQAAAAEKSEWRKLKWPLIVAGLLLFSLFLLVTGALVNPFSHSIETRAEKDPAKPSVSLADQNSQASSPNTQFAQPSPGEEMSPGVSNYVSSSKDSSNRNLSSDISSNENYSAPGASAKADPMAARDNGKTTTVFPSVSAPGTVPAQSIERAPSARTLTAAKIVEKSKPGSGAVANADAMQLKKLSAASPEAPAVHDRGFTNSTASKSSSPQTVTAATHEPLEPRAAHNPVPSEVAAGSAPASPNLTLAPTQQPIEPDSSPNTIASNGGATSIAGSSVATSRLNAAPGPGAAPATPARRGMTPNSTPSLSPEIQMDSPGQRVVKLRASRDENSFVNIPGERMLQSSLVTMHIQRSVRLPHESFGWLLHRDKEKKVVVGDLISRIEPQVPASQLAGNDSVEVRARIAPDGSVDSVRPLRGQQSLLPLVLKAVHAWHFEPTLVDGKPVETQSDVLIQFHSPRRAQP